MNPTINKRILETLLKGKLLESREIIEISMCLDRSSQEYKLIRDSAEHKAYTIVETVEIMSQDKSLHPIINEENHETIAPA